MRLEYFKEIEGLVGSGARLVFVDESGCQLGMDRRYARAPGGERAHCAKPFHRGEVINLIGALGATTVRAMMTVEGTVNADVIEAFAKDVLAPRLRRDDVVVWDNLGTHKVNRVIAHIEARGARVVFLPPYSPDLNPIELMWSKLKEVIRSHAPRTKKAFLRALKAALNEITPSNARAWFRHCLPEAQNV